MKKFDVTITARNLIFVGNSARAVGQLSHTNCGYTQKYQRFYINDARREVNIYEPAYIKGSGPSDWVQNPKFDMEILAALNSSTAEQPKGRCR